MLNLLNITIPVYFKFIIDLTFEFNRIPVR